MDDDTRYWYIKTHNLVKSKSEKARHGASMVQRERQSSEFTERMHIEIVATLRWSAGTNTRASESGTLEVKCEWPKSFFIYKPFQAWDVWVVKALKSHPLGSRDISCGSTDRSKISGKANHEWVDSFSCCGPCCESGSRNFWVRY